MADGCRHVRDEWARAMVFCKFSGFARFRDIDMVTC
jgi:hypothetical protein